MKIYETLPRQVRKSTTLVNGSEHVGHTELKKKWESKPTLPILTRLGREEPINMVIGYCDITPVPESPRV